MTTIVAITGGIGSGKSTFSNEVKDRGIKLLDSDQQVNQIYKKPTNDFISFLNKINLGGSVKNKKINKKFIFNTIFSNKTTRLKLENYIFKIIRKKRKLFVEDAKKNKDKIIFLDIPLLFENNLDKEFNIIISVIASKKERFKRLKISKNISKKTFNKILKSQTTDVERKKKSDIVIYNNLSTKLYLKKINNILDKIIK
tara:strand:+ start:83 stop:679 length:597 start_codon:yes stop_codon:yes gene_type:complete